MATKVDKGPLVVKQNNNAVKIVNTYFAYELDTWPKNHLKNFTLRSCLVEQLIS